MITPVVFVETKDSKKIQQESSSKTDSPASLKALLSAKDVAVQNRGSNSSEAHGVDRATRSAPRDASKSIELPKLDQGTPREVWQRYFAEQKPQPQAVAQIVRRLHEKQEYEHTIACIETALIEQPPQPWMYEVLGRSMELAKRPKADVERVMLSRIDFTAAAVPDMMLSAAYLKQLGLDERALALYQQTSRLAPTRPEPYLRGLQIARELNDAQAVAWGAAGVLTNVWLPGYESHHRESENIAAAVEESLRKAGRSSDADSLKAAVLAAHQRDLMLKLTWTGDADLDLIVEEPNGGICSFDNPFTTAGGAYTHDGYGPKAANCFEEYIGASALPGDYLVRVRLTDGEVVGRRATLTIRRYVGTSEESTKTMSVPVDGKDKVIRLSLNEGRRHALLERPATEWPVAAPQRNAIVGDRSVVSAQFAAGGSRPFVTGASVVGGGGAIGFQPVITNVREGIGFSAMAVVTGDRRYVRLSVQPMFSQIIGVNTFTIPSGR